MVWSRSKDCLVLAYFSWFNNEFFAQKLTEIWFRYRSEIAENSNDEFS